MIDFDTFRPTPDWEVSVDNSHFDEPVAAVNEHLNQLGADYFVAMAENAPKFGEMGYAVVGGGQDRSSKAAIVMPGTFANGIWPHIVARAEAVSFMAAEAGLRDSVGDIVPVVMTAAPSMQSSFGLSRQERSGIAAGNYGVIAQRHIPLLQELGYGALHGVFYSQAAALAPSFATATRGDFDRGNNILAEPPLAPLGFLREGLHFEAERKADGIGVIETLFADGQAAQKLGRGFLHEARENLAILKGFRQIDLGKDLLRLAMYSRKATFIHTDTSRVTPANFASTIFREIGPNIAQSHDDLRRLLVTGTNHSLADRVGRWATLVAANLTS